MNKMRFELNLAGLNELMKSEEMQDHLKEACETVADLAGEGHTVDVHTINYIAIGYVDANTPEADKANLESNVLLKALSTAGLPQTKG